MSDDHRTRLFEQLVTPHMDAAFNLARWLIRDQTDAEDVLQDALLRVHRFIGSCRAESSRQWVLRITRNACYDWLRGRKAEVTDGFADVNPDDGDGATFTADAFTEAALDPENSLLRSRRDHLVNDIIADLPPGYREIIILREIEDLSYKEIGEIIGVPVGTVMSRLSRARGQFIKEWNRRNG